MPPCGDRQQYTVADVVATLIIWVRAHPEFAVGTNEAGMHLGDDSRAADAAIWRRTRADVYEGGFQVRPPLLAVEVGGRDERKPSRAVRELSPLSMPLEEAMRTQRAVRRLKPDPVDDELVLRLIELATKAPSGSNQQNWEFVVVRDRAVKARLGRFNRMAFSLYSRIARRTADAKMLRII